MGGDDGDRRKVGFGYSVKKLREMSFLWEAKVVRFSEDSMKMYGFPGVEFNIMRRARFWRVCVYLYYSFHAIIFRSRASRGNSSSCILGVSFNSLDVFRSDLLELF